MVISDAKSGLTRAIAVALSDSFPPQLLSQYFTRKKLLKELESYGNGAGINALLDSMRASSPPAGPQTLNIKILGHSVIPQL
ncbi:UNVERIFIED_CONTAM: hypothetical protein Slati_2605900 [Sesamum latifolium]|uniref:Uncharacterized protein n=1 Tax=Sesamum latifolium TaxID=2727402 RepID=A0AAW2VY24_9LAMI